MARLVYVATESDALLRFQEPQPLREDLIRRLAPAAGAHWVAAASKGGILVGIGFAYSAGKALEMRIHAPGAISIHINRSLTAVVERNECFVIENDIRRAYTDVTLPFQKYWPRLEPILWAALRLGHGGTVLIAHPEDSWPQSLHVQLRLKPPYPARDPGHTSMMDSWSFGEPIDVIDFAPPRPNYFVGNLTAVDGATVLVADEDKLLNVVGFGAKITASNKPPCIEKSTILAPSAGQVHLEDIGGTRHQSAARFVWSNPRSVAFVASQDGSLSAMFMRGSELHVVGGYQYVVG
jgi:hypothetical protein